MYQCYKCGEKAVIHDADFKDEEGGIIIHACHCTNCGTEMDLKTLPKEE